MIACAVEQIFYQFPVRQDHHDFLCFLWWGGGDLESEPSEYRMRVHLFGATSSPGCAKFGLRQIADDYESLYGSDAAEFIRKKFYIDDGLTAVPTEDQVIHLLQATTDLCAEGRLRLHKVASNARYVESMPLSQRASSIRDLDINCDKLPIEKSFGVQWSLGLDTFHFLVTPAHSSTTKRGCYLH